MQTPRVSQRGPASSGVARQEEEDGADRRAPLGSGRARAGDGLACAGVAGLWRLVGPEGRRGKKEKKGRGRAGPDWSSGLKTVFPFLFFCKRFKHIQFKFEFKNSNSN